MARTGVERYKGCDWQDGNACSNDLGEVVLVPLVIVLAHVVLVLASAVVRLAHFGLLDAGYQQCINKWFATHGIMRQVRAAVVAEIAPMWA